MIRKILLFLFSYILITIGLTFILVYINLFSFGYSFFEYLEFIFTSIESLMFFIGLFIMTILVWNNTKK